MGVYTADILLSEAVYTADIVLSEGVYTVDIFSVVYTCTALFLNAHPWLCFM